MLFKSNLLTPLPACIELIPNNFYSVVIIAQLIIANVYHLRVYSQILAPYCRITEAKTTMTRETTTAEVSCYYTNTNSVVTQFHNVLNSLHSQLVF